MSQPLEAPRARWVWIDHRGVSSPPVPAARGCVEHRLACAQVPLRVRLPHDTQTEWMDLLSHGASPYVAATSGSVALRAPLALRPALTDLVTESGGC